MINPNDIKVGMVLGQADAMILRAAVARLNGLELEILTLRNVRDIPEGWKLVPIEPTKQMLEASYREASVYSPTAYRAMLAEAPTPPE